MRDAFGGVTNLVIIVVFLTLVSGYLAFNVNYTKAFRVKNKIISTFEQYEGVCDSDESECHRQIVSYMNSLGYSAPDFRIDGYTCRHGYCFKKIDVTKPTGSNLDDTKSKAYFKIVTQINIDIPIINKILPGLRIFQVSGDTKTIYASH